MILQMQKIYVYVKLSESQSSLFILSFLPQMSPMSSLWEQSSSPHGACSQSISRSSSPSQYIPSNHVGPVPRKRKELLPPSQGVSVSVQGGGLCPWGLCPEGLCPGCLCPGGVSFWVSVREIPRTVTGGWYTSYWNAFLLPKRFLRINILDDCLDQ